MTKERSIENLSFFDVHRHYLQTFLKDFQAEVSRFYCRIFHCFSYLLKIELDYHRVLSFISYPLVIVLRLESFEIKQPFRITFFDI